MANYTAYIELFGKKLKVKINANSEEDVEKTIKSRIVFHKIEKNNEKIDKELADLMHRMGMNL